jgi:hypothetical protein
LPAPSIITHRRLDGHTTCGKDCSDGRDITSNRPAATHDSPELARATPHAKAAMPTKATSPPRTHTRIRDAMNSTTRASGQSYATRETHPVRPAQSLSLRIPATVGRWHSKTHSPRSIHRNASRTSASPPRSWPPATASHPCPRFAVRLTQQSVSGPDESSPTTQSRQSRRRRTRPLRLPLPGLHTQHERALEPDEEADAQADRSRYGRLRCRRVPEYVPNSAILT